MKNQGMNLSEFLMYAKWGQFFVMAALILHVINGPRMAYLCDEMLL